MLVVVRSSFAHSVHVSMTSVEIVKVVYPPSISDTTTSFLVFVRLDAVVVLSGVVLVLEVEFSLVVAS